LFKLELPPVITPSFVLWVACLNPLVTMAAFSLDAEHHQEDDNLRGLVVGWVAEVVVEVDNRVGSGDGGSRTIQYFQLFTVDIDFDQGAAVQSEDIDKQDRELENPSDAVLKHDPNADDPLATVQWVI
jgi:hypothetical protein